MVEDIVFVLLVIIAIGAGVWVWWMEVTGKRIEPQNNIEKEELGEEIS